MPVYMYTHRLHIGVFDALNRKSLGRVLHLFLPQEMVWCVLCLYFDARAMLSLNNIDLLFGLKHGCQASPSLSWLLWRSSAGCFD